VLPHVDNKTLLSLRLCCKDTAHFVDTFRPLKYRAAYRLPREIIQHIYGYLGPPDCNAARHTCRAWMHASLDVGLLEVMLARGGWLSGGLNELSTRHHGKRSIAPNQWFLSTRLARECALLHQWYGNGLWRSSDILTAERCPSNAMRIRHTTDFTDLASADYSPKTELPCGLLFSVSNCGRYLLVAEGCLIYIYELSGVQIRPITSVLCPRRVLMMSMDTSAGRFAFAALLDGRMGLVSDLAVEPASTETPSPNVYSDRTLEHDSAGASPFAFHSLNGHSPDTSLHNNDDQVNTIHVRSTHQSVTLRNAARGTGEPAARQEWPRTYGPPYPQLLPSEFEALESIPRSFSPLSIYHSLCSPETPPRSIAICPSRRCVAFGCDTGIELHWIDSMSGRNLMKWFPLAAPSDFLYFLPSRRHLDSPHKLRLISSKAAPEQRGRLGFRRRFGFDWHSLRHNTSQADCDHYAARPLSDGSHVLFTDPSTGKLFLGCDAPIGGPTKLLRKISFEAPAEVYNSRDTPPSFYTSGTDLTWGVRIAAAYGNDVILYTVPPDVFADIKKVNGSADIPVHDDGDEYELGSWVDWIVPGPEGIPALPTRQLGPSRWPLAIRGAKIGTVPNVVDIAVQSAPDLIVWALTSTGAGHTWRVTDGTIRPPAHRVINSEGGVVPISNENGDWVMRDIGQESTAIVDLDGDVYMELDDEAAYEIAYEHGRSADYTPMPFADRDGDVRMLDVVDAFQNLHFGESSSSRHGFDGVCEFEIHDRPIMDVSATITQHVPPQREVDMVDVTDHDPFDLEVLCDDPVAPVRAMFPNMNLSAPTGPSVSPPAGVTTRIPTSSSTPNPTASSAYVRRSAPLDSSAPATPGATSTPSTASTTPVTPPTLSPRSRASMTLSHTSTRTVVHETVTGFVPRPRVTRTTSTVTMKDWIKVELENWRGHKDYREHMS
jgi:hypothetical protein